MDINQQKQLIEQYNKWIYKHAYKCVGICPSLEMEDLVSVGQFAIFDAIEKYKDTEGATLKTYIMNHIRYRILSELRNNFHYGPSHYNKILAVNKYKTIIEKEILNLEGIPRDATPEEISKCMHRYDLSKSYKLSPKQVKDMLEIANIYHTSIDRTFGEGDNLKIDIPDDIDIEMSAIMKNNKEVVRTAIFRLSEKEQKVITGRFFDEKTLEEIGNEMSCTREWIRQLEARSLKKLKIEIDKIINGETEVIKEKEVIIPNKKFMELINAHETLKNKYEHLDLKYKNLCDEYEILQTKTKCDIGEQVSTPFGRGIIFEVTASGFVVALDDGKYVSVKKREINGI